MRSKSKTPAETGASRDSFGGLSHSLFTPVAMQAQFLIAAHNVRPEVATMIAALVFGGGSYNG